MLPNHSPVVAAVRDAEALHPHRIDLGIGRAPGTDQRTAAALRRTPDRLGADTFPHDLIDLMGLLGDPRREHGMWQHFRATSAATSAPPIFLLGSSNYSAELAAYLGLGFAFAHHFAMHHDISGALQASESIAPASSLRPPSPSRTSSSVVLAATPKAHFRPGRHGSKPSPGNPRRSSPRTAVAHPVEQASQMPQPRRRRPGDGDDQLRGCESGRARAA
jgi:alkanesulfonate monooxygenase SsuD/methylene tetrahydromethanopterin reductase-like flavin-dependent oxidoreductase (luciferase family)